MSTEIDDVFNHGSSGLFLVDTQPNYKFEGFLRNLTRTQIVGESAFVVSPDEMSLRLLPDFRELLDDAGFSRDDKYELGQMLGEAVVPKLADTFPGVKNEDVLTVRVNQRTPLKAVGKEGNVIGLRYETNAYLKTIRSLAATFLGDYIDTSSWLGADWVPVSPVAMTNGRNWAAKKIQSDPRGALPSFVEFPNTISFVGLATNIMVGTDATGLKLAYSAR